MDPTSVTKVPMTAWEQAVIVVLFILFLGGVFAFIRWLLSWIKTLQREWQEFTAKLNKDWRDWMDEQRTQDRNVLNGINVSVIDLGKKLDLHDQKVDKRIDQIVVATRRKKAT